MVSFIKPMKKDIDRWYVVESEKEMMEKCRSLLEKKSAAVRVLPYEMDETVGRVLEGF